MELKETSERRIASNKLAIISMKNPVYTLGASNLSAKKRSELDYYGTDPKTIDSLLRRETFSHTVWEPCAGHHNIVNRLVESGYEVRASDIINYDGHAHEILDFLTNTSSWEHDIVTNPPFCLAEEFVLKSLETMREGSKLALLLRLQFLEGTRRYESIFRENPPCRVYVFPSRQVCSKTDDFTEGSAIAFAWFIWEKGFKGSPEIKWIYEKN